MKFVRFSLSHFRILRPIRYRYLPQLVLLLCIHSWASAAPPALPASDLAFNRIEQQFAEPSKLGTGLMARYLFLEGTGHILNDSSGNGNNISFSDLSIAPEWNADGSLTWNGSTTNYIPVAAAVQNAGTITVIVGNAVEAAAPGATIPISCNVPLGESGIVTAGAPYLRFCTTFNGSYSGHAYAQGYGTKYITAVQGGQIPNFGYSGPGIDNGIHVVSIEPATMTVYEDGVKLASNLQRSPAMVASPASGLIYDLGGARGEISGLGYVGRIYGAEFSTTVYSAAQQHRDYIAWNHLNDLKGGRLSPRYGPLKIHTVIELTKGESVAFGHNLPSAASQNFTVIGAMYLHAAYPALTFEGIADGSDAATGFTLAQVAQRQLTALSRTGVNLVAFHDHANSSSVGSGAFVGSGVGAPWTVGDTTGAANAMADMAGESGAVAGANAALPVGASRWLSEKWTDESSSGNDALKDVINPLIRNVGPKLFDAVVDPATDARFGANGASMSSATNCTLDAGGPKRATFQPDHTHPTLCGQQLLGHMKAAVEALTFFNAPFRPDSIAVASYTMWLPYLGRLIRRSATGAALTLMPCDGFLGGTVVIRLVNTGSVPDTIVATTEYNGGARDLVDGSATISLPADRRPRSLIARFAGDTTGGCGWMLR